MPRLAEHAIAGAVFEVVQREAAAGRYATLTSLLPRLTYIALAPFAGADEAIELVEGLKGAELAGARA